ncbi:AraC family ligand binding domain-containing protein, partial [Streptococcus merionis]|uniref:AraC family ligand binding domain-containing protein n=1 Tax=Streptococcus merionis TaxID=400065 RepID=UPI0026EFB043
MNLEELEIYLHHINVIEQKQQQTGVSIVDVGNISLTDFDAYYENGIFRFPKTLFFQGTQNIYISRHNRFAPMIEHVHDFIEMTYVYQGTCTQIIKGQKIELSQGSLCVLDRDVPHAIEPLGEADILINVLINEQTFSSLFLYKLEQDSSLLASFLADAFNQQANHDQFIIFDTSHYRQIHTQFQLMLAEYWGYGHHSEQFVAHYLQLIFMESLRIYE